MDDCTDLLPDYLSFLRGVVDSEDMPLSVSREMLQKSKLIRIIRKNIIKKATEMMMDLMADEELFKRFYKLYSKHLKLGVYSDAENRNRLVELLR